MAKKKDAKFKKSKIINFRITEDLYAKIMTRADSGRVTISNYVRNTLEDSVMTAGPQRN